MDAARLTAYGRRWWWLLLLGAVISVAVYGVAAKATQIEATPEFVASGTMFIALRDGEATPAMAAQTANFDRLIASYATMIEGEAVAHRAAQDLAVDVPAPDLSKSIDATPRLGSHLVEVRATAATPEDATALRDAFIRTFDRLADEQNLPGDPRPYENAAVVAAPRNESSMALGVMLVALAGLISAAGIVLAHEYMSGAIYDASDAEAATGLPALASIPNWRPDRDGLASGATAERYRMLRTNMALATRDAPARVIAIASPTAGSGTTTTAANIAAALAQSGKHVALVDANLRRPALHGILGVEPGAGLADALASRSELEIERATNAKGLTFVPAGNSPPNPAEMLDSPQFEHLVMDLEDRFDCVVIDCPPVLEATDAAIIAAKSAAVLLVLRAGRTTRRDAAEALAMLSQAQPRIIGSVINAAEAGSMIRRRAVGAEFAPAPEVAP